MKTIAELKVKSPSSKKGWKGKLNILSEILWYALAAGFYISGILGFSEWFKVIILSILLVEYKYWSGFSIKRTRNGIYINLGEL